MECPGLSISVTALQRRSIWARVTRRTRFLASRLKLPVRARAAPLLHVLASYCTVLYNPITPDSGIKQLQLFADD